MNSLPTLLTVANAAHFQQCSTRTVRRQLEPGGLLAGAVVRLGSGPRAAIRINRDVLLRALGLVSERQCRRDSATARRELISVRARFGAASADIEGAP